MSLCISCGSDKHEVLAQNTFFEGTDIVHCPVCGLVFPHPRPTADRVARFYREKYYSYGPVLGGVLRRLKLYFSGLRARHQHRWIKDASGTEKSGRVLEVGCGYGPLLALFARDGWEVWGIEPAEDCARYAAGKFSGSSHRVFHGTLEQFEPPGEEYFDLIVLSHVFEHFIAPEEVIGRLRKMLSPGGLIFFELPNSAARHYIETRYSLVPDFYFFNADNFNSFAHIHRFKAKEAGHIEYRRLSRSYGALGHAVNYAWWAVLDLFGLPCFASGGPGSIWLRSLVVKETAD